MRPAEDTPTLRRHGTIEFGVNWSRISDQEACMTLKPRPGPLLTKDQMERYSRQTILEEVGLQGQRKLLDSKVLIIGAGGLGSPAAIYLAAAGIGTPGNLDGGRVDFPQPPPLGNPRTPE